jgi:hypothetical protein
VTDRGPRYPTVALSEAISRAKSIYDREHMNPLTPAIAAEGMGYKGISGASLGAIAALRQYGLLEGRGNDVRLSKDAQTLILDDVNSPDYQGALQRIALKPPLFSELSKQFSQAASERNISVYLQKQGFKPSAASLAAKNFKEAFALAHSQPEAYIDDQIEASPKDHPMEQGQPFVGEPRRAPARPAEFANPQASPLRVVMNGDRLEIQASVDLAGLKKLQAMLEKYQSILEMMQPEGKGAAN